MGAVKPLPRHEAVKIMPTLEIPGRAESESSDGTSLHGVVVFFVSLDVLAVLGATVLGVVDTKASDDGAWAERLGDAEAMGKSVEPENIEENHLNDHSGREVFKGRHVVGAASALFDGADASFDVWNMLFLAADVEVLFEIGGDGATSAFEFRVAENELDAKASFGVDAVDPL